LGFCRNGGLLRGIQKKQPGNRTEKTKKRWAVPLCFPLLLPSLPDSIEEQADRSEHPLRSTRYMKSGSAKRERTKKLQEKQPDREEGRDERGSWREVR